MPNKLTVEDFLYFEKKVQEFNELLGNSLEDKSLIPTYQGLTEEEFRELEVAIEVGDEVEELDAIIDLIFVNFYNFNLNEHFLAESKEWFIKEMTNTHNPRTLAAVKNMKDYIKDYYSVNTGLFLYILGNQHRFDIRGAFDRVLESNMSKAIKDDGHVLVQKYIKEVEEKGRYKGVDYRKVKGYYVITALEDTLENKVYETPKIVKGSWTKTPDDLGGLEEFIL